MSELDNSDKRTRRKKGIPAAHPVSDNEDSYGWGNLTLAVQLLLPLALIALVFARKRIWIYPYPLLDTYISVLCPSFSQQQRLLKWMSTRIPHMNNLPNKIAQYWQNGSLLCTLINTVVPGACPNPQKHWKKPPIHGQALAYKYLGVAPILTEEDFNKPLTSYSERKFIKYLLQVQEAINKTSIEEDSLKFTSKYVARGMGLVIGEQNRPSYFYIYPNTGTNKMENILVNIKGPYNTFGTEMICSTKSKVKDMISKDKELKKLAYKSNAQRSFFRSVSFDIGPIMSLMGNKKNTGEILVKIDMEEDRAKVIFLPKFSGIYELLLTNDGQHLHGSPYVVRIMKSNKEIGDILQENCKNKIERKVIGKSIDFISESVSITDEFYLKLDGNNNTDKDKSDDESGYQDSGIFDFSETKKDLEDEVFETAKIISIEEVNSEKEEEVEKEGEKMDTDNYRDKSIETSRDKNINVSKDKNIDISRGIDLNTENRDKEISEVSQDEKLEIENRDFENLYNKYAEGDLIDKSTEINRDNKNISKLETSSKFIEISENSNTDFEILTKIPEFQKGRRITSVEKMVEIYETELKSSKSDPPKSASPVFDNIEQEASQIEVPADSPHLESRYEEISKESRPRLSRDFSVNLEDEEIYDTNVKEIKNIFERKSPSKEVKRFTTPSSYTKKNLKESTKKLAKSLPNLIDDLDKDNTEDEFVQKFKEKRNFWNNLIIQNSNASLNASSIDLSNSNNTKLLPRQYENVSQSTNCLHTKTGNKMRRKEDLYKTNSLDLTRDDTNKEKVRKITRAESLYDRIKIFDKDFDSGKHSTLLKRTKEKSDSQKLSKPEIPKPDSLTEVPNTTSTNQVEEDLRFAEIMKERFEISRRYFCSLETLTIKPNLTRRHSMESGNPPRLNQLQKGGSLKILNVFDRFSLDNLYKEVVLNKIKKDGKGGANNDTLMETLSSVSSCENSDRKDGKDFVEEDDLNTQFFNIRKRLRKRRSIKSIFDVNY